MPPSVRKYPPGADRRSTLNGWEWREEDGLQVATCVPFGAGTPFVHGFSGRRFDRAGLLAVMGTRDAELAEVRQVHGSLVVAADEVTRETEADGIVLTADSRVVAGVRTADCVPLLLIDAAGSAAAAVHAGWRGTAAGIAGAAVARLTALGCRPRGLRAALGPAIGGCCYRVGEDVAEAVAGASRGTDGIILRDRSGTRLDLRAALTAQLVSAGIPAGRIHAAPWCSACDPARFDSFRRDGGAAGRMLAVVGRARRP